LIIGISKDYGIFYMEVVPRGIEITNQYLKEGVMQRLYYANLK
jgi:hypothetical protein